jgi:hypothetical protein
VANTEEKEADVTMLYAFFCVNHPEESVQNSEHGES